MHLDITTDDVEPEVERIEGLGARRISDLQRIGSTSWITMTDPEATSSACAAASSGERPGAPAPTGHLDATMHIRYDAVMTKVRTTVTLDDAVLRAVKVRAARTGKRDSEVIEEALRRELGLDLLDRLWERNDLSEDDAMRLAVDAQHRSRRR